MALSATRFIRFALNLLNYDISFYLLIHLDHDATTQRPNEKKNNRRKQRITIKGTLHQRTQLKHSQTKALNSQSPNSMPLYRLQMDEEIFLLLHKQPFILLLRSRDVEEERAQCGL
jgi:hypothetical protein